MNSNLFMANSFDPVAGIYDDTFSKTQIGKAQRDIVWQYLDKKKLVNKHILEINCGTGEDAVFLSKNNIVTATDASEEMLEVTNHKIKLNEFQINCKTLLWDLNDPFPGDRDEKFDLIFSNFGGLNCLSPEALTNLSSELNSLLKPGGELIFVVMGRFCLMETLYFLLKGKWKSAFRRSSKKAVTAMLNNKTKVEIWYYSAKEIANVFNQYFNDVEKHPVGIFIPPSYFELFISKHPKLFNVFVSADKFLRGIGYFTRFSDHYIVSLKK